MDHKPKILAFCKYKKKNLPLTWSILDSRELLSLAYQHTITRGFPQNVPGMSEDYSLATHARNTLPASCVLQALLSSQLNDPSAWSV